MTTLHERFPGSDPQAQAHSLAKAIASAKFADSGILDLGGGVEVRCFVNCMLSPALRHLLGTMARDLVNVYAAKEAGLLRLPRQQGSDLDLGLFHRPEAQL